MRSDKEANSRRGFALRDLLIGSLILGICVLFVATKRQVNQSIWRGAICQSNVRQVGVALFMYAADYDGALPPGAGSFRGLATSTSPYMRDNSRYYCPNNTITPGNRRLTYRTPARYAGLPISGLWPDPYLGGKPVDPERTILVYETYFDEDAAIRPAYRHNGGAICLLFTGQTTTFQKLESSKK